MFSTDNGTRYPRYVNEFRKKCQTIKDEYSEGIRVGQDGRRWADQIAAYGPDTANWFCGCPSYRESPNHLCKHLIRLCIGVEGLLSNKPPMPFYGEVWRQTTPPILWVSGFHDPSRLEVRDLRSDTAAPILVDPIFIRDRSNPLGDGESSQFTPEEPVYDSEDE